MKLPDTPSINRKTRFISPKVEIIVACEGEVTERDYLEKCKKIYGSGFVKITWLPKNGVPLKVVKEAIKERDRLKEKAKKSKDSFDVFRVWAIFDRDEHPDVPEAIALAKSERIDVAFSDPCFELWPLLHLIDYGATHDRHKVQSLLHELMPTYHHDRSPIIDFEMIHKNFEIAYKRAIALNKSREAEGQPDSCPSTTVGVLVKKIIENGRSFKQANLKNRT